MKAEKHGIQLSQQSNSTLKDTNEKYLKLTVKYFHKNK